MIISNAHNSSSSTIDKRDTIPPSTSTTNAKDIDLSASAKTDYDPNNA